MRRVMKHREVRITTTIVFYDLDDETLQPVEGHRPDGQKFGNRRILSTELPDWAVNMTVAQMLDEVVSSAHTYLNTREAENSGA
jgi:hypothetical protein